MNEMDELGTRNTIDGERLCEMFSHAFKLLEHNVESINKLNVFPVPDGDTGTNMFMTLREAVANVEGLPPCTVGEAAKEIYDGAFKGAKGNSGVILAEFLKGMAHAFQSKTHCEAADWADAFQQSKIYAYRAVGEPKEGTILTVINQAAMTSRECVSSNQGVRETISAVSHAARETVARTPAMLPVLREAGMVDAGGHGLAIILEGLRQYLYNEHPDDLTIEPPPPVGLDEANASEISDAFLEMIDHESYGYCIQFTITGDSLDIDDMRERLAFVGQSIVVVGSEALVKVHLHAEDPGPSISCGASLGVLSEVSLVNMDDQRSRFSEARRIERTETYASTAPGEVSVVAVASGQGIEKIFLDDLGATAILPGGDTMNPSVSQIMEAVENAPTNDVIFLPNNKNIVLAARSAASASEKNLKVVQSETIPQGIAAMLQFNPERDMGANMEAMSSALYSVRTGEVVRSVRDVQLNGVSALEGQIIGLMERELVVAGDTSDDVLLSLLQYANPDEDELVTLYWGGELSEEKAVSMLDRVTNEFPEIEIELVSGGQPHYHFIVSIE